MLGFEIPSIVIIILAGLVSVIAFLALISRAIKLYQTVPPNKALVRYGSRGTKFFRGGGTFVISLIQKIDYLDLTVRTVTREKDEVLTIDNVRIKLDWVAQVQIDPKDENLETAARAFLGKEHSDIDEIISATLSANFRAIVGQMTVEEINRDRDAFVLKVQQLVSDDMIAMGSVVISMGIQEITDDKGYFEAMGAPRVAAIMRDAKIAEAEANRQARVKAAEARQAAEQAELDADRAILQQKQDLDLRQVELDKTVGLQRAKADQEVQAARALAVQQDLEATTLMPARAERDAVEIRAEAERRKATITAEAEAQAARTRAQGRADAVKSEATAQAEATTKIGQADADKLQALKMAEAQGLRQNLLAEAEGRREIASASAAEGEINLRQFIVQTLADADVRKTQAVAQAMGNIGGNVRLVQFNGESGGSGNSLMDLLLQVPETAAMLNAKVEALSGEDMMAQLTRVLQLLANLKVVDSAGNGESQQDAS